LIYSTVITIIKVINYDEHEIMSNNDVGHWIMVRRAMLRMSQARLAKAVGVDQSYISLIERNERPLTDELLQRIAAALECKPEELARWPQAA
jgi:DNA-binding Xre family transcriptional regulator